MSVYHYYLHVLYKLQCFIGIPTTEKNSTLSPHMKNCSNFTFKIVNQLQTHHLGTWRFLFCSTRFLSHFTTHTFRRYWVEHLKRNVICPWVLYDFSRIYKWFFFYFVVHVNEDSRQRWECFTWSLWILANIGWAAYLQRSS